MSLVTQQNLLKKELGLRDLVLTQIVFVVGDLVGWDGRETRPVTNSLLVARDPPLLSACCRRCHLSDQTHAAGGRSLPMGKIRLQRLYRFHGRMESLAARHRRHGGNRSGDCDATLLRHRTKRRMASGKSNLCFGAKRCAHCRFDSA